MKFEQNPDWESLHFQASTIFDLHAHPGLNISLFNRMLTNRFYPSTRAFDPFSVRTNYPRLKAGGVDILLSVQYAPEKGILVEMGMLIDISHSTPAARARIYEIVGNRAPLLATHVGAYEINPDSYNLEDWEIKKVADSGGIVGVIFMNYWLMPHETNRGMNFISRTLDHFINVGGIDHVGIGSDFDGFTDPPDDMKDASELPRLTQRLLADGYSQEMILKIWGGNALRVLRQGWKKA